MFYVFCRNQFIIKHIGMEFPKAFFPEGETNKFLKKFKAGLSKRLSLSRMNELLEEARLGYYLHALERDKEALVVAEFLPAQVEFTGNFNIWTGVGDALVLSARLNRLAGNQAKHQADIARLKEHPIWHKMPQPVILEMIKQAPGKIAAGAVNPSLKWGVQEMANEAMKLTWFAETNLGGFAHHGYYDTKQVEISLKGALNKLRERISK